MVLEQPEVAVAVSLILSVISFLAWIYMVGVKWGTLDTKVSLLWEIYVKDALSETTRLQRGNPKPINVHEVFSEGVIEEIRKVGENNKNHKHEALLISIEKKLGDELMRIATEKKLSYRVILGFAVLLAEGSLK